MRRTCSSPFILASALLATVASAQTGRTITTLTAPGLGVTAQFRANYPNTEAGNFGWYVMAGHQTGTVPLPIPGFTVYGSCRVDPAALIQTFFFLLDITGASSFSISVPRTVAFLGFPFDLQTLDANLVTGELAWGDNDSEVVVGQGTLGPLPSANFAVIPAGSFSMGSNAAAGAPYFPQANERPVHIVTFAEQFWMGKYEVTQADYQAVMGTNPSFHQGTSYPNSANRPVEQVSYNQAMVFCASLTDREQAAGRVPTGWVYRLPTEAEWEYACRAGSTSEFSMGSTLNCPVANYSTCVGQTAVVGSYAPNAFGLYDMHGNVSEWCLDSWDGSANYPAGTVPNRYSSAGSTRIVRGGGIGYQSYYCRSAFRTSLVPSASSVSCGFRVVLAPRAVPIALARIPAGTFQMGSTSGASNEQSVHQVTIAQPFWMGTCEVTQAEYQAVMGNNPSAFSGPSRPVEQVSWNDAMAYCAALTTTERAAGRVPAGYQYRLPTEAEWEYCCRAGTTTEWNTGSSIVFWQANFGYQSGGGQTNNVGSYEVNAFGLFDMHGNVSEWCLDAWDGSNNYNAAAVSDPYVSSGPYRVIRGGSYYNNSFYCRSAFRNYFMPTNWTTDFGFRVVLAPILVP